ncbi:MAG TPA: PAC2 family protein [Candidatus Nanoarchaeia archaeon]|nr:PAC2 family protein [Candidatus Nanoarchaeia archaeon]
MFEFIHLSKPAISKAIVIEGLPGIGNVGKIAVDFIIESINAKKIVSIYSQSFPHSVFVNENNLIDLPAISIYHKRLHNQDFLFIAGDVQPLDEKSCHEFCNALLDYLEKLKTREIITLGGIGLPKIPKQPKVYITGNDKKLISKYSLTGVEKNIFGVVGPIIGVSGLLAGLASKRAIPSVILLAQTFGHPTYMGIKGSRELIKLLSKSFSFKVNLNALDKEISELESAVKITIPQSFATLTPPKDKVTYIG